MNWKIYATFMVIGPVNPSFMVIDLDWSCSLTLASVGGWGLVQPSNEPSEMAAEQLGGSL